jgi:hypothetical protein
MPGAGWPAGPMHAGMARLPAFVAAFGAPRADPRGGRGMR